MKDKDKSLDFLFKQAKRQDSKSSFKHTKELFEENMSGGVTTQLVKEGSSIAKLKILLMIIGMLGLLTTLSVLAYNASQVSSDTVIHRTEYGPTFSDKKRNVLPITNEAGNQEEAIIRSITIKDDSAFDHITKYAMQEGGGFIRTEVTDYREDYALANEVIKERSVNDEPYRFPVLNEDEIKENEQNKREMLKRLAKMDRKFYSFIPSGAYNVNGRVVSVNAFYMRKTEITLLEYRTFLFDLLIADRKDDFLVAKPDQELWLTLGGFSEPMKNLYFSHPAYDDYPVNNISRAGALLYCEWLSEEVTKLGGSKRKHKTWRARIPTDLEWMWAAYGGANEEYLYPWKSNEVLKEDKCYMANFKPMVADSTGEMVNSYLLDGGFFTVKVDSYFPNDFGLYNMSGNLCEMVVLSGNGNSPGTKGGSWMDDKEELIITAGDLHKGEVNPHLGIGFRPVFTFLND